MITLYPYWYRNDSRVLKDSQRQVNNNEGVNQNLETPVVIQHVQPVKDNKKIKLVMLVFRTYNAV